MSVTALRSAAIGLAMFHIASGNACIHPKFRVVAQTIKGSGQALSKSSGGQNTTMDMPLYSISVDYEKLNWVQHQHLVSDGMDVKIDEIVNWRTGMVAQRTVEGTGRSQCTIGEFPWIVRGLYKRIAEMITDRFVGLFKCVGHHDDLDEYAFPRIAFHPKGPLAKLIPGSFDMSAQVDLDAAGVFKEVSVYSRIISADVNIETLDNMTFTEARPGGPSEEDLKVPDSWNCSKSPSRDAKDILVDWLRSDSSFKGHMRIIPYALAAAMSEADSAFVV